MGEDREWKETARWIKYEEDVEEGSDRWGKPHVASLSFHSLLNLRRCLETGVVLLDLNEKDLPAVAYRVVEQVRSPKESLLLHVTDPFSLCRWSSRISSTSTTSRRSCDRCCCAIVT